MTQLTDKEIDSIAEFMNTQWPSQLQWSKARDAVAKLRSEVSGETEVVLVDCDDYQALYINGKLDSYNEDDTFDFKFGFEVAKKYPNAVLTRQEVDHDWLWEKYNGKMPQDLSDCYFL